MKYYSEVTKKMYKTIDDLNAAEKKAAAKHDEDEKKRKDLEADVKGVEDAFKFANDAYDKANEKLATLVEKYGEVRVISKGNDVLDDLLGLLF